MQTEIEALILKELGDIKSTMSATEATVNTLKERLFDGPSSVITTLQSNISEIKKARETDQKWDRIHNIAHYGLTPLVVAIHAIARHFGIEI